MKRSLKILGTLIASGAFLAPQAILPPLPAQAAPPDICATPGKDNPITLSGVVNTYYPGTATVSAGGQSITLGASRGASTGITQGDLLMIIQMQDADIDSTNTDSYGDGVSGGVANGSTNLNTAGLYEYVVATNTVGTGGGTLNVAQGLAYTYTNADYTSTHGQRHFQVIRIPQYASATISGTVTAAPWDGTSGGIVAFDVAGSLAFSGGSIDVSGQGFRGGGGRNTTGTGTNPASSNTDYVSLSSNPYHGSKGEGIAGTPRYIRNDVTTTVTDTGIEGYPNGSFARGGPANAGGGGTDPSTRNNGANTGGGGGANHGGGGKGGDSWTDTFGRQPTGGFGGAAFATTVTHVVMGGGGGAGSANDSPSGPYPSGGGGGGIVMVRTNQITGNGTILADGISGVTPAGTDGGGGGGAAGTVLIQAVTTSSPSLTIDARGGKGLDSGYFEHGPGGGGGGGYVAYQGFTPTANVIAGQPGNDKPGGTVNPAADPYGATAGQNGLALSTAIPPAQVKPGAVCGPQLTVSKTTSTANVAPGGTATYTITVSNAAGQSDATGVNLSDTLPSGFTYAATSTVQLSGGATRTTTTNPTTGTSTPVWGQFTIPAGGSVAITFTVNVAGNQSPGIYQNPATATYLDPKRTTTTGTTTATYDSASSTGEDVAVGSVPNLLLVKRITAINGVNVNQYVHNSSSTDDQAANWPLPLDAASSVSTYLRGVINGGTVQPGDVLEYTIYFLSTGNAAATNVSLCDLIPANSTFVPNSFNGMTPTDGGLPGVDSGIALAIGSTTPTVYLSNADDAPDRGRFFASGSIPTATCSSANTNGAIVVRLVSSPTTLPNATAPGTPSGSYGFIRFRARVN